MTTNLDFSCNSLNEYYEIVDPARTCGYVDKDGYEYDYDLEILYMLNYFDFFENL